MGLGDEPDLAHWSMEENTREICGGWDLDWFITRLRVDRASCTIHPQESKPLPCKLATSKQPVCTLHILTHRQLGTEAVWLVRHLIEYLAPLCL